MIVLHGTAISNYYNKVKFALLEKGIPFSEETTLPSQGDAITKHSPLGKIPFIQTEHGYLSESQAILEYLEDTYPANPLYPSNAFERAKCREFIQHLELNVELIARRLYSEAIFGGKVTQETKDEVLAKLEIGLQGLTRLTRFAPYALGDRFTAADLVGWPHFQLVGFATEQVYGKNLVAQFIPDIEAYLQLIESRPHAQQVSTDRAAALAKFFKDR